MRISLEKFIFVLLYFYLIIDTFNGILVREYSISISPLYKTLVLILMMFFLLKKRIFKPFFILVLIVMLLLIHILMGIFTVLEFFWIFKFFMILVTFYFFKYIVEHEGLIRLKKLFIISFWVITVNLLLGALGYGYSQYGNDIGTRGFFYAGNEIGGLLIIVSIFLLSWYLIREDIISYLFFSLLILLLSALLTSKVALLGSFLIIFILPIIRLISTSNNFIVRKSSFLLNFVSILIILLVVPYTVYYALYEMNLIERISYWSSRLDYLTLLFSSRNIWALEIFKFITNDNNLINWLFGYGFGKILDIIGKSVEIDIIDLFMLFGFLGITIVYGFFIYLLLINSKKSSDLYPFKPYVQFTIILILILSVTSGHIMNSGLASILIGAIISLFYYKGRIHEK